MNKEYGLAISEFKKVVQVNPLDLSAQERLIHAYNLNKEHDKAKALLEQNIFKEPDRLKILNDLALYSLRNGNVKKAINYFSDALTLDPDSEKAYLRLFSTYIISDQTELALSTLKTSILKIPDSLNLRLNLGNTYNKLNMPDKAIEQYNYILNKIDKNNSYIHLFLANTYSLTKKNDRSAEIHYKNAIQLDPNNMRAYNDFAWFYAERNKNLEQSLSLVQKAIKLSPNDPYIIDTLGWIYFKMEKFDQALDSLNQAVTLLSEDEPMIKYHLALALLSNGENEKAIIKLNQALSSQKQFPEKTAAQHLLKKLTQ